MRGVKVPPHASLMEIMVTHLPRPMVAAKVKTTFIENSMRLGTILLIVLILLLVGAIPTWPYSSSWGYAPSGVLGVVLPVVLVLLMGRL